jgi:hypothetical protein
MKKAKKVVVKPKVVKPKVAAKPKVVAKKVAVKKAKTVSKKVAKPKVAAKKPRKYNIRGGVVGSPISASGTTIQERIAEIKRRREEVERLRQEADREETLRQEADREAVEARARRIAKEKEDREKLRIAVEEAVRRSNIRQRNSSLSRFANLPHDKKLEIFASNYKNLKDYEDASGETLTRARNENSTKYRRQNDVLNGVRSSPKETSSSFGIFN